MSVRRTVLSAAVCTALLAGCGSSTTPATDAPATGTSSGSYPVTVRNCGRSVTFTDKPTRIVSGWVTGTELLLALGVPSDDIVGLYNTSSFSGPRPSFAAAYDGIKTLSSTAPTREALLTAAPDLIYADGNYLFDGKQLPTIAELAKAGTQVLVLSGFCDAGGASKVTDVDADLAALGPALGVQARAKELAGRVDRRLAAVTPSGAAEPVAVISGGKTAYVYEGVYSDIVQRAGGRNVYAGTLPKGQYYGALSIEDLTVRDPATLVYLLSGGESETEARAYLTRTFPTVAAVEDDHVVYLPQEDASNLRAVDSVEKVAAALKRFR